MLNKMIFPIMIGVTGIALLCICGLLVAGHGVFATLAAESKADEYAKLADTYYSQHRVYEAIDALTKSLQLNPRQPKVWHFRGLCYFSLKKPAPAIQDFSKVLVLTTDSDDDSVFLRADTYAIRGDCFQELHADRRAIADWRQCVAIMPKAHQDSSQYLGTAKELSWLLATSPDAAARNGTEAVRYAHLAIAARPAWETPPSGTADPYNETLAAAEARTGNYQQAIILEMQQIASGEKDQARRLQLYQQGKPYTAEYTPVP